MTAHEYEEEASDASREVKKRELKGAGQEGCRLQEERLPMGKLQVSSTDQV